MDGIEERKDLKQGRNRRKGIEGMKGGTLTSLPSTTSIATSAASATIIIVRVVTHLIIIIGGKKNIKEGRAGRIARKG
jgi:hypothetical protein